MESPKTFPIMAVGGCHAFDLPWTLIAPHEAQAVANHGQTLARLAERGGLSATEAYAVMNGLSLRESLRRKNDAAYAWEWLRSRAEDAEISKLRAESDSLRSALSAARAALDGEMGHADLLAFTLDKAAGTRREAADAHRDRRARRAAEAQPTPVRCPECDGTGRRVKYHGGSVNDPTVIGLAMEASPCWCQAEARP